MTAKPYVLAVLERATKSAAQAALLVLGADQINALAVGWADVGGFAAGGFVLSVLTSLATSGFGSNGPAAFGPETIAPEYEGKHERGEAGESALYLILVALAVIAVFLLIIRLV